ncbi:sodium:proton antiporter, partial [Leifsonia sp. SIMBA_070]
VLDLFGSGGGAEVARRLSAGQDEEGPLLASVPLSIPLRAGGDTGAPSVVTDPADPAAVAIRAVPGRLAPRSRGLAGRKLGLSV